MPNEIEKLAVGPGFCELDRWVRFSALARFVSLEQALPRSLLCGVNSCM